MKKIILVSFICSCLMLGGCGKSELLDSKSLDKVKSTEENISLDNTNIKQDTLIVESKGINEIAKEINEKFPCNDNVKLTTYTDKSLITSMMLGAFGGLESEPSVIKNAVQICNDNPHNPKDIYEIIIFDVGENNGNFPAALSCAVDLKASLSVRYDTIGLNAIKNNELTFQEYDEFMYPKVEYNDRYVWAIMGNDLNDCDINIIP